MDSIHDFEGLSADLAVLQSTGEFGDVTFLVEGEEILAHRNLLASRSKYFRMLLFGGLAESLQEKIELDVKLKPFKQILRFIYTGRVELEQLKDDEIRDLFALAHEYQIESVLTDVAKTLLSKLSLETFYLLYNLVVTYDLKPFREDCEKFAKDNSSTLPKHQSFNILWAPALKALLKLSFVDDEIDIFNAVKVWCEHNPTIDAKSILANIQYSDISIHDLVQKVKPTGLVDCEVLLGAIAAKFERENTDLVCDSCILHRCHIIKKPVIRLQSAGPTS